MTSTNWEEDFQNEVGHATEELLAKHFNITHLVNSPLYHYSDNVKIQSIIENQVFNASFIRSTSDSLEFVYPLSYCRDWHCIKNVFFDFKNFPTNLFKHFNEQAVYPIARPYFISLSENSNSERLISNYGEYKLILKSTNEEKYRERIRIVGSFVKCKYSDNPDKEIHDILNEWQTEIFQPLLIKYQFNNPEKNLGLWFYILMKLCFTISTSVKQLAYADEKEIRFVAYPRNLDADDVWHNSRVLKPIGTPATSFREYLPIKLLELGMTAYQG